MARLPSSSWVNTSEGPCWLPHAVTWEWGELGRADWVNLNATEAALSQRQAFDLFRGTIWPSWLCTGKDGGGAATCQPTFSPRSLSVIFLDSAWCERGRKWAFTVASKLWSNSLRSPKQFAILTLSLSAAWFMTRSERAYSCCSFLYALPLNWSGSMTVFFINTFMNLGLLGPLDTSILSKIYCFYGSV